MKRRVAVFAGGYSQEAAVSLKSAAMVMNNIDREVYDPLLIRISRAGWEAEFKGLTFAVDRANCSVQLPDRLFVPDVAFIMVHGTPGEDGHLQGYFDMINLPYTTGGVLNMALTFDKGLTTQTLRAMPLPTTTGVLLRGSDGHDLEQLLSVVGLPCFVKPNRGGSSIGMSKVKTAAELPDALKKAFAEDSQVLVERFVSGTEVTCGVIPWEGGARALPATEIVSENEFFDFEAKYLGKSQEITPARISAAAMTAVQNLALQIYDAFECRGMIRVDMMVVNDAPLVIEINTVPGFTEASIIPQQAAVEGISKAQLIDAVLRGVK